MKSLSRYSFLFVISLVVVHGAIAQPALEPASFSNIRTLFINEIGEHSHLFRTKEYGGYEKNIVGHPYFNSSEMQKGDIFYNGVLYENVPFQYDIVRQEIVMKHYNQKFLVSLLTEKVKYFSIEGHRFENIAADEENGDIKQNIYEVLFEGSVRVFAKRIKRVESSLKAEGAPRFVERNEYFLKNDTTLFHVNEKTSLLHSLRDNEKLIETYMRTNKFKFKNNIEKELLMVAGYYSTLNKK